MMKSSPDKIQFVADACLNHLIAEPELLGQFMTETGTTPDEMRAGDSQSLADGLLAFFAQNESALLSMCANARLTPEEVMRAYYSLNVHE
ncbi:DUF3572 family protein [Maritalea mediterranea]|uniref:DUF3572 domain-containing protein n=1 Tax=Maritalea mediterranea TaxID=2909667 RepID=A0ABS9EAI2_9HYPH|nr:DUF3572 family protein [Maritalea mediterranea]MCF4099896.1 DUF3572 domain-containing protein [Maritalea mediterranea]